MLKSYVQWIIAPQKIELPDQDIHIWMVNLKDHCRASDYYFQLLSDDECNRAYQYFLERDKKYFIIARGVLRKLIGQYLCLDPREIKFYYNPYDKPYIDLNNKQNELYFNLSHSGDVALYIFSKKCEVGIDIEKIKPMDDFEDIAKRFFSRKENMALQLVPIAQRLESFFRCWTRKEAFIKIIGNGLSYPLDKFEVTLKPTEPAMLLKVWDNPALVEKLALFDLTPCFDYVAAFFTEKSTRKFEYWKYNYLRV